MSKGKGVSRLHRPCRRRVGYASPVEAINGLSSTMPTRSFLKR